MITVFIEKSRSPYVDVLLDKGKFMKSEYMKSSSPWEVGACVSRNNDLCETTRLLS